MAKQKLPRWATTVTPLSKTIALAMFVIFPVCGFYLGMYYQQVLDMNKPQNVTVVHTVTLPDGRIPCNTNDDCSANYFCTQAGPIVYSPNQKSTRSCWKKGEMIPN